MWALVWFQVMTGLGVEHYHLGSYGSLEECKVALTQAEVMRTNGNVKIACLELRVQS